MAQSSLVDFLKKNGTEIKFLTYFENLVNVYSYWLVFCYLQQWGLIALLWGNEMAVQYKMAIVTQ
jgi:hypothetical protein